MFAPVRLILLFLIGLVFLYAGLVNPLMMMAGGTGSPFYDRFGEGGVQAVELLLGLLLVGGSAWQIRREYRRFREGQGPRA